MNVIYVPLGGEEWPVIVGADGKIAKVRINNIWLIEQSLSAPMLWVLQSVLDEMPSNTEVPV